MQRRFHKIPNEQIVKYLMRNSLHERMSGALESNTTGELPPTEFDDVVNTANTNIQKIEILR